MFNRIYNDVASGPTNTTVKVTEQRAPTDDSVRLLKEMEEAARKKITESTTVHNTEFTCRQVRHHLHSQWQAEQDRRLSRAL